MNNAEMLITKFNNRPAWKIYKSELISGLKFKDLFNFYLLSVELEEFPDALKAADEMAKRGVNDRFFTSSKFLKMRQYRLFDLIQKAARDTYTALQKKNEEFIKALDSLYTLDQQVFNYRTENKLLRDFPDSLAKINDNNMREQLRLIEKYGLPSEKVLGPQFINDTVFSRHQKYMLVPIHCLQMTKDSLLKQCCKEVYLKAFFRGEIDKVLFEMFQSLSGIDNTGNLGRRVYCDYNHRLFKGNSFSEKSLKFIDEFRKKYGYCSLDDLEAKLRFYLKYYSKRYRFDLTYTLYPPSAITEEAFKKLDEDYRLIYDPKQ